MPAQTAQKAAEAFAEQIAGTVPNAQQQQAVKANIIAGINEFQQQVQQGREPGIDLSAIVADAAKEAQLSSDVAASLTAKVDTQASQFLQLVNNAQSTAAQVLQAQFTQTDTVMNENNQLRSEASKTQQQFEGFDKAVNIHKPEGQQQLNEKIRWMVNARNTMAEIRLDPPELGSMQVRVNVSGDAASVSFVVQSQQAKDALAEAMPKLRDMLSEQGIELGDAQVRKDNSSGNESGQQFANNSSASTGEQNGPNSDGMDESAVIEQSITREMKGGIDYYA
jgi:flagellar hook-length control protein FliK